VSICTINVTGIVELPKRGKVFKYLLDNYFNIYLLQETHLLDVTQGKLWETQWGAHALWSPGTNQSARVARVVQYTQSESSRVV